MSTWHDYCHVDIPKEDEKISKYNHEENSLKAPFIIYADLECILKKEQSRQNNPKNSYTEREAKHKPSGYSWSLICSFDATKNRYNFYRGKDFIERFCKDVKDLAIEISNYREQEMMPLTDEEIKFYKGQKACHICKKKFSYDKNKESKFKLYQKVRDHCHYTGKFRGAAHNTCNLTYKVPKEIPIVFHNGSIYDYHFIIKQLAKEFKGQFKCLGENTEKYITFSIPIKKEYDKGKTSTYKLKFIDNYRFMQSKLSDLHDSLSGIFNKECKSCMEKKIFFQNSEFDYIGFRDNRLNYKCKECGKRCSKLISKAVWNFTITYKFCKDDFDKFVLLLRNVVYPYEYMDSWERFNETSIPPKEAYYSKLNEEDISDADYAVCSKSMGHVWNKKPRWESWFVCFER